MNGKMNPATRLLNAIAAPFAFRHQSVLGDNLGNFLGEDDMTEMLAKVAKWSLHTGTHTGRHCIYQSIECCEKA